MDQWVRVLGTQVDSWDPQYLIYMLGKERTGAVRVSSDLQALWHNMCVHMNMK